MPTGSRARIAALPLFAIAVSLAPVSLVAQAIQRRDSAGITIVTSPPGVADRPSGWTLDSEPDLQMGVSAGDSRYEFSRIAGIAPLPDGRIAVVDGASCEIRFFDARGVFVRSVGRRGNGPGEFRQPRLVPALRYDSLLIADNSLSRLTTFRLDGTVAPTVPTSGRYLALGQIAPSRIVAISPLPLVASADPTVNHHQRVIRLISVPGGESDTVAAFPFLIISARGPTGEHFSDFPPFTGPGIAAMGRSAVFAANGVDADIRKYDATGRLTAIYRVGKTLVPVSPRQFSDSLARVWGRWAGAAVGRIASEVPVSRAQPPWKSLAADADGNVWAEMHDGVVRNTVDWTVIASDGAAIGTVSTPANYDVRYIGADFVLGVWRDADGVEFVRRYRLRKP
jgi:hypothetical protein